MLLIQDLHVEVAGNKVLKGLNLHIAPGENFVLFGPNGSGKTTLLMTIMGFSNYTVTRGAITFKGKDITHAPMYERARLGIGMAFQRPPTIHGLTVEGMLNLCHRKDSVMNVDNMAKYMKFENFLDRDVNAGFSGGEIKRSEMLQLMAQEPDLVLFDEPESGVDLENMAVIGRAARQILSDEPGDVPHCSSASAKDCCPRQKKPLTSNKSGLIITHTGYILDYINADRAQVMYEGHLCCDARPGDILEHIRQFGYQECLNCFMDNKELLPLAEPQESTHV